VAYNFVTKEPTQTVTREIGHPEIVMVALLQ